MFNNQYLSITLKGFALNVSHAPARPSLATLKGQGTHGETVLLLKPSNTTAFTLDAALIKHLMPAVGQAFPSSFSLNIAEVLGAQLPTSKVVSAAGNFSVNLSQLPILGKELPKGLTFSAQNLAVSFSTHAVADTRAINALLPPGATPLPKTLPQGVGFAANLSLGQTQLLLQNVVQAANASKGGGQATPPPHTGTLHRHFGPLTLEAIALGLQAGNLSLSLSASLKLGPLHIAFKGLKASTPLATLGQAAPSYTLQGLGLAYQNQPHNPSLSLAGAFEHQGNGYAGGVVMSLKALQLAALGAYEDLPTGPSLFIYALVEKALGGPAFFYVEGLAATFGYNRNFIAPPVSQVSTFALVQLAANPGKAPKGGSIAEDAASIMESLAGNIPPQPGSYFTGLGIKFTSFRVLNSFALLVLKFGNGLAADLLGQSTYVAPDPSAAEPVARVQLAVLGQYNTTTGNLMLRGQLSPASFVFNPNNQLQGGFAIGLWTGGTHVGEFVYSFGGYGKSYSPPAYYPQHIPPIGFNWQVDHALSLKGSGYWAITPQAIMAGGTLQATYHTSEVHAAFLLEANLLFSWAPLHYQAQVSVTFDLSVYVNLLLWSGWMGFHLGASLAIQGPPFGGSASLDLSVVTVSINFGSTANTPEYLTGPQFASKHLPAPAKAGSPPPIVSLRIAKGLVKEVKDGQGNTVALINPKDLLITTHSAVPCTHINYCTQAPCTTPTHSYTGTAFTVVPMNAVYDGNTHKSTHQVRLTGKNGNEAQLTCAPSPAEAAPKAIWAKHPPAQEASNSAGSSATTPLNFGATLKPAQPIPASHTIAVPRSTLATDPHTGSTAHWASPGTATPKAEAANSIATGPIEATLFNALAQRQQLAQASPSNYNGAAERLKALGSTPIPVYA